MVAYCTLLYSIVYQKEEEEEKEKDVEAKVPKKK